MPATAIATSPHPVIELHGVTRVYGEGEHAVHALRGVDLAIGAREFVAIMGASGSGKSTLMNLLGCLDAPTAGRYLLDGEDVGTLSADRKADLRNRTLGFVFQNYSLLPRTTALDNVALPLLYAGVRRKDVRPRARAALERVGLGDRLLHHPNQMSGGQQQRVAIARAIVTRPAVILADEPTGNLDTRTSLEIMALFQELSREGMTIVLVTHEHDIAAFATRVVVVKDGRIAGDRPQVAAAAAAALAALPEEPS
ncbi:MAG: ABC transporter ATP-binding protein [Myxococcales bacterium]|nr:ABC transporter ATP-binding protein [Myxococcales bacterium]MBK7191251.1 ABC transporter ATP-binding protein [Myxococcales bacterium]MBP6843246.1 ABC transporter ATP-binding protein [Kofleriaceae bacterium]